jgi:hypothetical protein
MLMRRRRDPEKWGAASHLGSDLRSRHDASPSRALEIDRRKVNEQIAAKRRRLDALPPLQDADLQVEVSTERPVMARPGNHIPHPLGALGARLCAMLDTGGRWQCWPPSSAGRGDPGDQRG